MKSTLKIGLTGGIAAGKSTCAIIFASLGVTVHEADEIARELLAHDLQIKQKCIEYFGSEILSANQIDRKKIRQIIFSDSKARIWFNQLMHAKIRAELENRSKVNVNYYHLLVIPLLFESGYDYNLDKVITVVSRQQLQRAVQRDMADQNQIKSIMQTQVTDAVRYQKSDYIIFNNGQELRPQILSIHSQIRSG